VLDNVRINEEKVVFRKAPSRFQHENISDAEGNKQVLRPVYQLEDINRRSTDGRVYKEKLAPVRVTVLFITYCL
jgi:hypothetical protein